MPDVGYSPPEGFLTQAQAQERLRISKTKMQRLIRDGRISGFRDPRDERYRLFKVEDVEALARPVPEEGKGEAAA